MSNNSTHEFFMQGTQAAGAVSEAVIPLSGGWRFWRHQVQAEVVLTADGSIAVPTAGVLTVKGKLPGASTFQELGTLSLIAPDPTLFEGYYGALEAYSTSLDADKTWKLYVVSGG